MTNNDIIQTISKTLKKLREEKGLSQQQLVDQIGDYNLSLRSYKSYESGNSNRVPLLDKLILLADFYKCPLDYIVYGRECLYDDSFLRIDEFKRLAALIYSLVLIPVRETNPDNDYYNKYYFISYDDDLHLLVEKINTKSMEMNHYYYKNDKKIMGLYKEYKTIINGMEDLNEDMQPTPERLIETLKRNGIDPDVYWENVKSKIKKHSSK